MPLPLLPLLTLPVWWLYKPDTEHMAGCEVLPVCLPYRAVSIVIFCLTFCVLLCLIILTSDFLDLPLCSVCLIGLMFVYMLSACLLTLVFWIAPVYVNGFNCYSGFDPLPDFKFKFKFKLSFIVIPLHVGTYSGTKCRASQDHGAT